jgi:hypothetical protein
VRAVAGAAFDHLRSASSSGAAKSLGGALGALGGFVGGLGAAAAEIRAGYHARGRETVVANDGALRRDDPGSEASAAASSAGFPPELPRAVAASALADAASAFFERATSASDADATRAREILALAPEFSASSDERDERNASDGAAFRRLRALRDASVATTLMLRFGVDLAPGGRGALRPELDVARQVERCLDESGGGGDEGGASREATATANVHPEAGVEGEGVEGEGVEGEGVEGGVFGGFFFPGGAASARARETKPPWARADELARIAEALTGAKEYVSHSSKASASASSSLAARKRLAALDATTACARRAFAAGSVAVAASLGSRLAALGHAPAWDVAAALVFAAEADDPPGAGDAVGGERAVRAMHAFATLAAPARRLPDLVEAWQSLEAKRLARAAEEAANAKANKNKNENAARGRGRGIVRGGEGGREEKEEEKEKEKEEQRDAGFAARDERKSAAAFSAARSETLRRAAPGVGASAWLRPRLRAFAEGPLPGLLAAVEADDDAKDADDESFSSAEDTLPEDAPSEDAPSGTPPEPDHPLRAPAASAALALAYGLGALDAAPSDAVFEPIAVAETVAFARENARSSDASSTSDASAIIPASSASSHFSVPLGRLATLGSASSARRVVERAALEAGGPEEERVVLALGARAFELRAVDPRDPDARRRAAANTARAKSHSYSRSDEEATDAEKSARDATEGREGLEGLESGLEGRSGSLGSEVASSEVAAMRSLRGRLAAREDAAFAVGILGSDRVDVDAFVADDPAGTRVAVVFALADHAAGHGHGRGHERDDAADRGGGPTSSDSGSGSGSDSSEHVFLRALAMARAYGANETDVAARRLGGAVLRSARRRRGVGSDASSNADGSFEVGSKTSGADAAALGAARRDPARASARFRSDVWPALVASDARASAFAAYYDVLANAHEGGVDANDPNVPRVTLVRHDAEGREGAASLEETRLRFARAAAAASAFAVVFDAADGAALRFAALAGPDGGAPERTHGGALGSLVAVSDALAARARATRALPSVEDVEALERAAATLPRLRFDASALFLAAASATLAPGPLSSSGPAALSSGGGGGGRGAGAGAGGARPSPRGGAARRGSWRAPGTPNTSGWSRGGPRSAPATRSERGPRRRLLCRARRRRRLPRAPPRGRRSGKPTPIATSPGSRRPRDELSRSAVRAPGVFVRGRGAPVASRRRGGGVRIASGRARKRKRGGRF